MDKMKKVAKDIIYRIEQYEAGFSSMSQTVYEIKASMRMIDEEISWFEHTLKTTGMGA